MRMVVCRGVGGDPTPIPGWGVAGRGDKRKTHRLFELVEVSDSPQVSPLPHDAPRWAGAEHHLEWSFLKNPRVLALALGLQPTAFRLALRQVAEIDLYLRTEEDLYLIELKGTKYKQAGTTRHCKDALEQIVEYWSQSRMWLQNGAKRVHLLAVCPAVPRERPKILGILDEIKRSRLQGSDAPELDLLFYNLFQHAGERVLVLWRAEEESPC